MKNPSHYNVNLYLHNDNTSKNPAFLHFTKSAVTAIITLILVYDWNQLEFFILCMMHTVKDNFFRHCPAPTLLPSKRSKTFFTYAVVKICCFYISQFKVSRRIRANYLTSFIAPRFDREFWSEPPASLLLPWSSLILKTAQFRTLRFQRLSYLFAMMFL